MINLSRAPLIVARKKVVEIGGGRVSKGGTSAIEEQINMHFDKQTESDIRFMLREITKDEIRRQERINNPPSRIYVDNRSQPIENVKYRTEVEFGMDVPLMLLKAIERRLEQTIVRAVPRSWKNNPQRREMTGYNQAINVSSGWQWKYRSDPNGYYQNVNPYSYFRKNVFDAGGKLILVPKAGAVGFLNFLASQKDSAKTSKRGRGFMQRSIAGLKRNRYARNYTIYIKFTSTHVANGEIRYISARNGGLTVTPYVNVIARRRKRAYRRF